MLDTGAGTRDPSWDGAVERRLLVRDSTMSGIPVAAPSAQASTAGCYSLERISEQQAMTPLPLPKVLLCDLDGTLIDSMPVLAELAAEVLEQQYGTPRVLGRELYLATCGLPFVRQLQEMFPGDPRNGDTAAAFERAKPDRCRTVVMATDTLRALAQIQSRGARVVISSNNGSKNVDAFARAAGFPFDMVLGFGPGMAKGKPHLDAVTRRFGVGRNEMLFVGDSIHDGEMAEREDVPFVGIASTFSAERFLLRFPRVPVVRRLAALPALLR